MKKLGLVLATAAVLTFSAIPLTTQPARADGGVILAVLAGAWLVSCVGHHHHKRGKRHHHGWCWH